MVVALSGCKGDSKAEARRYQTAHDSFIASVRSDSARLANEVAPVYLDRRAAGEASPGPGVVREFQPQYDEFNRAYCQALQAIAEAASAGSPDLAARRIDETRAVAQDLVFDAMAFALAQSALAAPSERRDELLSALNVEAQASDGTKLSGVAALQRAGLVGSDGRFTLPERDTREYEEYKTWASNEAEGFAGRVDTLIEPTQSKLQECLPRR
jgi:hypothetical protein